MLHAFLQKLLRLRGEMLNVSAQQREVNMDGGLKRSRPRLCQKRPIDPAANSLKCCDCQKRVPPNHMNPLHLPLAIDCDEQTHMAPNVIDTSQGWIRRPDFIEQQTGGCPAV